jgi:hypothetical protein
VLAVERVSFETAKSFALAPAHAIVRPEQSIDLYLQGQIWPAPSNAVPSFQGLFRSQVVLPAHDFIYSFASESL